MISYEPLWQTMKRKHATTYTLRSKHVDKIGSGTIARLKENQSVSTNTINSLCNILKCNITDIIKYVPD